MSEREQLLGFFGLSAGASLQEIVNAYSERAGAAAERLRDGDESARVELEVLREAYERLTGRKPGVVVSNATAAAEYGPRVPAWWESYLSLVAAFCSLALLVAVFTYFPHIYKEGGFAYPLALLLLAAAFSVVATMAAEGELQYGGRGRFLSAKGIETREGPVLVRWRVAWLSSLFSRAVRWLIVASLVAVVLLNFASLSGRWSLRD